MQNKTKKEIKKTYRYSDSNYAIILNVYNDGSVEEIKILESLQGKNRRREYDYREPLFKFTHHNQKLTLNLN